MDTGSNSCHTLTIRIIELGRDADGSLQAGGRPVLVISNDKANEYSPIITIIPFL